jgi:hypothetical protein
LLHKYFPKFVKKSKPVKAKIELPDGALGKELSKKNYIDYLKKRYGDWKQIELSKKEKNSTGLLLLFHYLKDIKHQELIILMFGILMI